MAALTALQLVQKVLVNLRANSTITDFSDAYSALVLEYVNVAKEEVEDSWRWRVLSSEVKFTTVQSQTNYFIDAAANSPSVTLASGNYPDDRSSLLYDDQDNVMAFDITNVAANSIYPLKHVARENIVSDVYLAPSRTPVQPYAFAFTTEGNRPQIILDDPPLASRLLTFRFTVPQPQLVNTTDSLLVPWRPVVTRAIALAISERGEELAGGVDYNSLYAMQLIRAQENDRDRSYDQFMNKGTGQSNITTFF